MTPEVAGRADKEPRGGYARKLMPKVSTGF